MYPAMTDLKAVRAVGAHRDQRMDVALPPSRAKRSSTRPPLAGRVVRGHSTNQVSSIGKRLHQGHAES